jgi:hypothetical protein
MKPNNLVFAVGIALPILLIGALFAVIYLPSLNVKPAYDFVYSSEGEYYGPYRQYKNSYEVKGGRLVIRENSFPEDAVPYEDAPRLYRYTVADDTVREISFEETAQFSLEPGPSSPDGYIVSYEYRGSGSFFPFGGSSSGGYFVKKDNASKRLTAMSRDQFDRNMTFLGWVIP